ncbi:Thiol-disulfide isomerase or thioredoxin [bacterium A37T11]|nr:Thiol-disulfide isomerase or thioredoxin [bacterium A37T11]
MILKKIIFLLCGICMVIYCKAQSQRHLQIGDTVPNVRLTHLINYPNKEANLFDFKAKLLILDFWDVFCAPCIANMPKMEALQQELGPDIRVLLVTRSSVELVNSLLSKNEKARNCKLPMLIGDTLLSSLFSYQTVPAYAWIDKQGILRHFTGTKQFLNASAIRQFIRGDTLTMPVKNEYGNFNSLESLLTEGGGRNLSKVDYYSLISHWVNFDGQFSAPLFDTKTGKHIGLHIINQSRVNLFLYAYEDCFPVDGFRHQENRVLIELPDSINYQQFEQHFLDDNWKNKNLFCYESRLPPERIHLIREVMKRDLANYFAVNVKSEKRRKQCLVLKSLNQTEPGYKIRSAGGKPYKSSPHTRDSLVLVNSAFSDLIRGIDRLFSQQDGAGKILVNETNIGLSSPVDIRLTGNIQDFIVMRQQLRHYGLDLVTEEKLIPVIILYN